MPNSADTLLAETNALRAIVGAPPWTMGDLALELRQRLYTAELAIGHRDRLLFEANLALNDFIPGDGRTCRDLEDLLEMVCPQFRVKVEVRAGFQRVIVRVEGAEGCFAIDSQARAWAAEQEAPPEGWHTAAHWSSLRFCLQAELEERLTDVLLEAEPEFFAPKEELHRSRDATLWLVSAGPRLPRFILEYDDGTRLFAPRKNPKGLAMFLASLGKAARGFLRTRVLSGVTCLLESLARAGVDHGPWAEDISQALESATRTTLVMVRVTLPLPFAVVTSEVLAALKGALLSSGLRLKVIKATPRAKFTARYPDGRKVEKSLLEHIRGLVCEAMEKAGWNA
jgi:hypothetical protein